MCYQAAQLTHVLDGRLKELSEDAEWERALKEVATATMKEKRKVAEATEKKATMSKKARALAKKRSTELEMKLGGTELKLAKARSLNLAHANELADLKATLEACENKWYNKGFADAENSSKPVIRQAQKLGFKKGWLATLQAMRVPKDSILRNQIPFLNPFPTIQNPSNTVDEEETPNIRELVQAIDSHVELVDLKVTSNLRASNQPNENVQLQLSQPRVSQNNHPRTQPCSSMSTLQLIPGFTFCSFFNLTLLFLGLPTVIGLW